MPLPKPRLKHSKLSLLGVARTWLQKERGVTEDDWRAILEAHAGVRSARELDERGFEMVLDHLARIGFVSTSRQSGFGERLGFASPGQNNLIRKLWAEAVTHPTSQALGTFLEHQAGVSSLRFLPDDKASKVITVLRAMVKRRKAASTARAPMTPGEG